MDIRIIAATNRDLEEAIRDGRFREELYYRLNVIALTMPPLRKRGTDILLLAKHFIATYARTFDRQVDGLSAETVQYLLNYDWPGNVRELQNVIERGVVMGLDSLIRPEDLPETLIEARPSESPSVARYHEGVNNAKKRIILSALEQSGGTVTEAAKLLDLNPNYLHRLLKNLHLRPSGDRGPASS